MTVLSLRAYLVKETMKGGKGVKNTQKFDHVKVQFYNRLNKSAHGRWLMVYMEENFI